MVGAASCAGRGCCGARGARDGRRERRYVTGLAVALPEESRTAASEGTLARRAHAYFVNASAPALAT